jgi:hypothetical protein
MRVPRVPIRPLTPNWSASSRTACTAIDDDRKFVRAANVGSEAMQTEDQQRIAGISQKYRWRNPEGEDVDFLSPDEIENLTIRAGTLTTKERQVINYHIVATIKMLEALPGRVT